MNKLFKLEIREAEINYRVELTLVPGNYLIMGSSDRYVSFSFRDTIKEVFNYWLNELDTNEEVAFFPVDLEDEYVGGILVKKEGENCSMVYAYTQEAHGYTFEFSQPISEQIDLNTLKIITSEFGTINTTVNEIKHSVECLFNMLPDKYIIGMEEQNKRALE